MHSSSLFSIIRCSTDHQYSYNWRYSVCRAAAGPGRLSRRHVASRRRSAAARPLPAAILDRVPPAGSPAAIQRAGGPGRAAAGGGACSVQLQRAHRPRGGDCARCTARPDGAESVHQTRCDGTDSGAAETVAQTDRQSSIACSWWPLNAQPTGYGR